MSKIMMIGMLCLMSNLSFAAKCTNPDIVDTAIAAGNFTTLVTALKAANLVDTLKGPGPFTVFAPTDAAFTKLPVGVLPSLLADIPKLTNILTYHVAAGKFDSATLITMGMVKSLQGQEIMITVKNGDAYANDAKIISKDICASNGVIHAIDTVLMPK